MDEQQHKNLEQAKWEENVRGTENAAKRIFPHEKWVNAVSIKFKYQSEDLDLSIGTENIKVARSRLTHLKNDEQILTKEINQGKILAEKGASVYLLPKLKSPDGKYIPGPDALVNGVLLEFKTVTGSIGKFERRFRESREQGQNVFIRVLNPDISMQNVIQKMYNVVNDPKYTGGFKGDLIFSVKHGKFESIHHAKISDFKR
jgi:hypothetical protein